MELLKQAGWSTIRTHLFHFRTASGQEVDFLLESDAGAIAGIEVKASATVTGHDFNDLRALAEMTGARFHRGIVLYTGSDTVAFGPNLFAAGERSLAELSSLAGYAALGWTMIPPPSTD